MPVTPAEIDAVSSLVFDLCGIVLDQSKGYLIESRLTSVMQTAGARTFHDLVSGARGAESTEPCETSGLAPSISRKRVRRRSGIGTTSGDP